MTIPHAPWCHIDAIVSLDRWDGTVRPDARLGPSRVISISQCCCESGYMVTVESNGIPHKLDLNWLAPPDHVWTNCKNPSCRFRRGRSVHCLPGQESTAQCNECFSR